MIGIKFVIKNEYDIILSKILYDIDCSNFRWKIEDEEVLGEQGKSFFAKLITVMMNFKKLFKRSTIQYT